MIVVEEDACCLGQLDRRNASVVSCVRDFHTSTIECVFDFLVYERAFGATGFVEIELGAW